MKHKSRKNKNYQIEDQTGKKLNLKIKFRESFRPFAPSVLSEHVSEWFNLDEDSPYMTFVSSIHKSKQTKIKKIEESSFGIEKLNVLRSFIPAVTHVDYSARVQTVNRNTNSRFHKLISKFYDITGCPMLINTSFNVSNISQPTSFTYSNIGVSSIYSLSHISSSTYYLEFENWFMNSQGNSMNNISTPLGVTI